MEFKVQLKAFEDNLWTSYLLIPNELALKLKNENTKRVICTIDQKHSFRAGVLSMKGGFKYIMISKEKIKSYDLHFNQTLSVLLEKDTSKYGMEMPEVFQAFLDQDHNFKILFQNLTPGKQRSLIYYVLKIKSETKQIEKTTVIANHLKKMNGIIDFKLLQKDFKEFSQSRNLGAL